MPDKKTCDEPADGKRQMVALLREILTKAEEGRFEGILVLTEGAERNSLLQHYRGTESASLLPHLNAQFQQFLAILGNPDAVATAAEKQLTQTATLLQKARGNEGN